MASFAFRYELLKCYYWEILGKSSTAPKGPDSVTLTRNFAEKSPEREVSTYLLRVILDPPPNCAVRLGLQSRIKADDGQVYSLVSLYWTVGQSTSLWRSLQSVKAYL